MRSFFSVSIFPLRVSTSESILSLRASSLAMRSFFSVSIFSLRTATSESILSLVSSILCLFSLTSNSRTFILSSTIVIRFSASSILPESSLIIVSRFSSSLANSSLINLTVSINSPSTRRHSCILIPSWSSTTTDSPSCNSCLTHLVPSQSFT